MGTGVSQQEILLTTGISRCGGTELGVKWQNDFMGSDELGLQRHRRFIGAASAHPADVRAKELM